MDYSQTERFSKRWREKERKIKAIKRKGMERKRKGRASTRDRKTGSIKYNLNKKEAMHLNVNLLRLQTPVDRVMCDFSIDVGFSHIFLHPHTLSESGG